MIYSAKNLIYNISYITFGSFILSNIIYNKIRKKTCLLCAGRFFTTEFWIFFWFSNYLLYNYSCKKIKK